MLSSDMSSSSGDDWSRRNYLNFRGAPQASGGTTPSESCPALCRAPTPCLLCSRVAATRMAPIGYVCGCRQCRAALLRRYDEVGQAAEDDDQDPACERDASREPRRQRRDRLEVPFRDAAHRAELE